MSSALYMSHFPNFSLEGDQDHGPTLTLSNDPSLLYPFVIDNSRDQEARVGNHDQIEVLYPFLVNKSNGQQGRVDLDHNKKEINEHIFMAGSSSTTAAASSIHGTMTDNRTDQQTSSDQLVVSRHDLSHGQVQGQWMPADMGFLKKMMKSDRMIEKKPRKSSIQASHHEQFISTSNNNSSNAIIRVCSACNTTKTPLWRTGPCGPKSLCNACGIRQRKARRAALAAANGGSVPCPAQSFKVKKNKRSCDHIDRTLPIKKRCKITTTNKVAPTKITTKDEIIISLSKNSAFHRVFPQEETDAAILLMALSCSLVHS